MVLDQYDYSTWFTDTGYITDSYPTTGTLQTPYVNFKFNEDGTIEPKGDVHEFGYREIFSFSVKITNFTSPSYKHQYVEWKSSRNN